MKLQGHKNINITKSVVLKTINLKHQIYANDYMMRSHIDRIVQPDNTITIHISFTSNQNNSLTHTRILSFAIIHPFFQNSNAQPTTLTDIKKVRKNKTSMFNIIYLFKFCNTFNTRVKRYLSFYHPVLSTQQNLP